MLFADVFVKMPQREIRVHVALEPAQQFDGTGLYPLAARSPAALVHDCIQSIVFYSPAHPPHLPRRHTHYFGRPHPAPPRARRLVNRPPPVVGWPPPPHLPLDVLHRVALADP